MDRARDIEIAEISAIMGTRSGRNVFCRMLEQAGVFDKAFNKDPYLHAYTSGRREMGLEWLNELRSAAPGETKMMLAEREDAQNTA